jgi:hypothetical protein
MTSESIKIIVSILLTAMTSGVVLGKLNKLRTRTAKIEDINSLVNP